MNKWILGLVVGLCLCSAAPPSFAGEQIRLANGEWPPYHSHKLKYYGLASRVVTEAFALEGVTVQYKFFPWKRGMELAKRGELDGTAVWRHKPKFEKFFHYSDPVLASKAVFFHLKSYALEWTVFDDLKGIRIGGTIGYGYNADYDNAEKSKDFKIRRVPKDELNFKMLLARRIDIFPITAEVGYHILKTKFTPDEFQSVTHHPNSLTPVQEQSLHLLLPKNKEKSLRLLEAFNRGLKKAQSQWQVRAILRGIQARGLSPHAVNQFDFPRILLTTCIMWFPCYKKGRYW